MRTGCFSESLKSYHLNGCPSSLYDLIWGHATVMIHSGKPVFIFAFQSPTLGFSLSFLWKWIGQESHHSWGQRWSTSTCKGGTSGDQVSSSQHDPLALTNSTMFHHLSTKSHNTQLKPQYSVLPKWGKDSIASRSYFLTSILGVSHSPLFSKFPKISYFQRLIFLPPSSTHCLTCQMCVLVTQLCLTLCDSEDCSPIGSSVHGIL